MRSTAPNATATCAVAQIFSYSFSRSAAPSFLESFEPARDAAGIEDHRRRHHRAGERSPARLVASGDREDAFVERAPLAPESRAQDRLGERQALGEGFAGHDARTMRGIKPKSIEESECMWMTGNPRGMLVFKS